MQRRLLDRLIPSSAFSGRQAMCWLRLSSTTCKIVQQSPNSPPACVCTDRRFKTMRCNGRIVGFLLLAPLCLPGQVPVKRVVLYKNGVGYFEHLGQVRGNQDVTIPFTSGQLNDVLKSLTVLDLNVGRITGVGYGSSTPADRQLGELRLPVGDKASLTEFLG